MVTKIKVSGKQAWQWILDHSGRHGCLVVTDGLTVADLEAACGKGALSAARRYCERRSGVPSGALGGAGTGEVYPYAACDMDIADAMVLDGWSRERAEDYAQNYWILVVNPQSKNRLCHHVRKMGQEQPTDKICMHYSQVG